MEKAKRIADAITTLTMTLATRWDDIYEEQDNGRRLQPPSSILWNPQLGYSLAENTRGPAYYSGYINLLEAAQNDRAIEQCLQRLLDACNLVSDLD